jgi:hypothetical protein
MIISCHQPNFLPWSPFFEKIQNADLFVLLENVQYTRHQFQNRFNYFNKWMTMPVENGNLQDLIKDKRYINPEISWKSIKSKVNASFLDEFDHLISDSLSDTNIGLIESISKVLTIETRIVRDSPSMSSDRSENLLNICLQYGATEYLSGPSGRKYLNERIFLENGINVTYFDANEHMPIIEKLRSSYEY